MYLREAHLACLRVEIRNFPALDTGELVQLEFRQTKIDSSTVLHSTSVYFIPLFDINYEAITNMPRLLKLGILLGLLWGLKSP